MLKSFLLMTILVLGTACSSTTSKMNQGSSEITSGVSAVENVESSVDRAIATEKRIYQYGKK